AGYEGYGYGYGYGQENSGNYGYGVAASNSWEMANSDVDMNPDGSGGDVMAKMNQRLDMVPHMEAESMQGGHYGAGGDRYDSYESYDSRSSMNDRDMYRSGYDYNEAEPDNDNTYEGPYDNFYGNRRDQYQNRTRDGFGQRGQNWGRDGRNNRPATSAYPGRAGGQWNEPPQAMGSRGLGPHGSSRLPSLFSHNILPEVGMFQGARGFAGSMRYGGGMMKQRMRRNWKMWDSDFKVRLGRKPLGKVLAGGRSSLLIPPVGSMDLTLGRGRARGTRSSFSDPKIDGGNSPPLPKLGGVAGVRFEAEPSGAGGALTIQEEISQIKRKLQAGKKTQERQKKRHRDRMVERIQFVCSLCKYRTFYDDEMTNHLESKFHKEHFKFVGTKLPQQTADFLQEYVANKTRKTEERRKAIDDINAVIQQIYRDQDLTQDVGMEHFIKKVEAAHCAACDLFIPMQYGIIQKHLKSLDHNHNRRAMMEQSKKSSLVVARSILNNKLISKKLERYLKGENPFTDDPEEKEEHEEGEGGTGGNAEEGTAENKDEEENAEEENPEEENPEENPEEENPEEENPEEGNVEEENKDPEEPPEAGNGGEGEETGTGTETAARAQAEAGTEPAEQQNSPPAAESLREDEEPQPVEAAAAEEEEEDAEEAAATQEEEEEE
ncbi:AKP8L protein, partial [Halcyon senegalensis]|nr:AKP8L protein [Halcyon senegalensis]